VLSECFALGIPARNTRTTVRIGQNRPVDVGPVSAALVQSSCQFVVVGSAARALVDHEVAGPFGPRDLDIVVADTDADRNAAATALTAIGGRVAVTGGWREVAAFPGWSWSVLTPYGPVDVVFRFADGSDYAAQRSRARPVAIDGALVWCHPTRHAA